MGVALAGGRLPPVWRGILREAIEAGLDVEAGMHEFLADDPELVGPRGRARRGAARLRRPPADLSVPTGENLTHGAAVVLTVGSDCAIGKKTVAVELDRAARARGIRSVFVPTGQTGITIEGWGIAVDAVVSDFLAGAAERLVVEGAKRGDLLFVEGQGAILHPQFSGVTLGLYHGAAPHALVLCHKAGDVEIEGSRSTRSRRSRSSSRSTSGSPSRCARRGSPRRAQHAASTRTPRGGGRGHRGGDRPPRRRPCPFRPDALA